MTSDIFTETGCGGRHAAMTLTILSLPGELLLQIFRHLGYRDLLSAGQVCRHWRDLSEDSLLLQGIAARDFGHIHYTDQEVCLAVLLGMGLFKWI